MLIMSKQAGNILGYGYSQAPKLNMSHYESWRRSIDMEISMGLLERNDDGSLKDIQFELTSDLMQRSVVNQHVWLSQFMDLSTGEWLPEDERLF